MGVDEEMAVRVGGLAKQDGRQGFIVRMTISGLKR